MRITNRSRVEIDRALWRRLAGELGLSGELPAAIRDDCGLFTSKHLIAMIQPSSRKEKGNAGSFSCGQITIYTCQDCTEGRVLWAYAHELVHAWYESYCSDEYFDEAVEGIADCFADAIIAKLGGSIGDHDLCGSYVLDAEGARGTRRTNPDRFDARDMLDYCASRIRGSRASR